MKENEKSQAQLEMAESLKVQVDLEQEAHQLEEDIHAMREKLEHRQLEGLPILELLKEEEHIAYLEKQLERKRYQLSHVENKVSEQQEALVSKVREEKTWQSIKETRKEEFYHDQKMIEQNELDDLNTVRAYMLARNG
ncbi:flagellar export protein FliJ [Pseudalkalibacillus hwajinpoensis]|uniref:flagellar export protein FliJ n=1 Tax=Guptibacillus hwajinpoensis TaxID=208199 RepID=UPI001A7E210F|nr:flagellar FliJ family protein [Pseudalkalibacillus hwajinpoensis]